MISRFYRKGGVIIQGDVVTLPKTYLSSDAITGFS